MRHCSNDSVDVYEAAGDDLAELLHEAGDLLVTLEDYSHANIVTGVGIDTAYLVTLYVH